MTIAKAQVSWWCETSEESMDGGSGWGTELLGPFATSREAKKAAGVKDGQIEYHHGKPQHRFLVSVFQAASLEEARRLRNLDDE